MARAFSISRRISSVQGSAPKMPMRTRRLSGSMPLSRTVSPMYMA